MKRTLAILAIALFVLILAGCEDYEYADVEYNSNSRFELIAKYDGNSQHIYVDKQTGVQYIVVNPGSKYGSWGSVLFGADGLPLLYERK